MLRELVIQDFAIIDDLRLTLSGGLNVLTGETGAGKSILIDALGAVLGDRVGPEVVRTGAKLARVEAIFDLNHISLPPRFHELLEEFSIELEEDELILSREIHAAGRSTARLNGRATTVSSLAAIGEHLVDIHGQSDHLSLLRQSEHLGILDQYARTVVDRQEVAALVHQLRHVQQQIEAIDRSSREREQRIDYLRYQIAEIEAADLEPDEEASLITERSILANSERLAELASETYALLKGADEVADEPALPVIPALDRVVSNLHLLATLVQDLTPLAERTEELRYLIEDVAAEARSFAERIDRDPAKLEAVEERLSLVRDLKRKYGPTEGDVLALANHSRTELESLTGPGASKEALYDQAQRLETQLATMAVALSEKRQAAASELSGAVEAAIQHLNMGRAHFAVEVSQQPDERGLTISDGTGPPRTVAVTETGIDRVTFLIAPNKGETLKPLARIASGGETARLMLALKSILSEADATSTLVFDEIDVGVGGRSGQVVGEKLWQIASNHQVIVITHLPQIAAFGSSHLRIAKHEQNGRVVSLVNEISGADRIDELAAMLDGLPVTAESRQNALALQQRIERWIAEHAAAPTR